MSTASASGGPAKTATAPSPGSRWNPSSAGPSRSSVRTWMRSGRSYRRDGTFPTGYSSEWKIAGSRPSSSSKPVRAIVKTSPSGPGGSFWVLDTAPASWPAKSAVMATATPGSPFVCGTGPFLWNRNWRDAAGRSHVWIPSGTSPSSPSRPLKPTSNISSTPGAHRSRGCLMSRRWFRNGSHSGCALYLARPRLALNASRHGGGPWVHCLATTAPSRSRLRFRAARVGKRYVGHHTNGTRVPG